MSSSLSTEQLKNFYSTEGNLFTRLVRVLCIDSSVANRVIAFWLWLEENGYQSINEEIVGRSFTDNVVKALVGEALAIMTIIDGETLPGDVSNEQFPATFGILENHVSIATMYEARVSVREGIARQLLDVCSRTFKAEDEGINSSQRNDIVGGMLIVPYVNKVQPVVGRPVTERSIIDQHRPRMIFPTFPFAMEGLHPGFGFRPANQFFFRGTQPAPIPMRPLPMVVPPPKIIARAESFVAGPHFQSGGGCSNLLSVKPRFPVGGRSVRHTVMPHFQIGGSSSFQQVNPPPFVPEVAVHPIENAEGSSIPENRALFATFSKGYAVSTDELGDYLTTTYGDIVEAIYMEHTRPGVQPLFARVLLRSPENLEQVLQEKERVKLVIHGKHVYVRKHVYTRKFVRKN